MDRRIKPVVRKGSFQDAENNEIQDYQNLSSEECLKIVFDLEQQYCLWKHGYVPQKLQKVVSYRKFKDVS